MAGEASREQKGTFVARLLERRRQRIQAASPAVVDPGRPYFCGKGPFLVILILALLGLFATGFLSYRHILLASNAGVMGESALCKADGKINCDAILMTEHSELFGLVSSAVLGLMGFVFVFWCSVNALFNDRLRKIVLALLVLYFFAALGFSWYYVYLMAFEVDYVCTWCIVVHVINLCSFVFVLALVTKKRKELLLRETATRAERAYFLIGGVLASLLVFFAAGMAQKNLSFQDAKSKYEETANDPAVIMALIMSSPTYDLPITQEDPVYGAPNAPYPIVLFSDFQCPVCAKAELFLKTLVDANPAVLRLVFKNYPLSTECNRVVLGNLHPYACKAARAAYAAHLVGGSRAFWAYADLLFVHQRRLGNGEWVEYAREIGLDARRFASLLSPGSPVDKKLHEDIELGISIRMSATPQIYVTGKRIPDTLKGEFFVGTVEELIRRTLPPDREVRLRRPW